MTSTGFGCAPSHVPSRRSIPHIRNCWKKAHTSEAQEIHRLGVVNGTALWKSVEPLDPLQIEPRIQGVPVRMVNELEIDLAWGFINSILYNHLQIRMSVFQYYTDGMISGNLDLPLDFTMTQFESGRGFWFAATEESWKAPLLENSSFCISWDDKQTVNSFLLIQYQRVFAGWTVPQPYWYLFY